MKREKKEIKQAPSKTPQKQGWVMVLNVALLLIWTIFAVIIGQIVVGWVLIWMVGAETFGRPAVQAIYTLLVYVMAIILVVWVPRVLGFWRGKNTRSVLGLRGLPTWTDIGLAPIGYIVAMLIAAVLTGLFSVFPWFNADAAQATGFSLYLSGIDRVLAFVCLVVLAPIVEEVIFRGWLYGHLRNMTARRGVISVVISAFLTSLVFGLVHLQWNVGVTVFAMSLVMCVLREITGTIYADILVHMIKNGVAFYLLYVVHIM